MTLTIIASIVFLAHVAVWLGLPASPLAEELPPASVSTGVVALEMGLEPA